MAVTLTPGTAVGSSVFGNPSNEAQAAQAIVNAVMTLATGFKTSWSYDSAAHTLTVTFS
jgi:hypothetical protein